jgi:16S rRNA (guanine527-N7)-methyltransferase
LIDRAVGVPGVSRETRERLEVFEALIRRWSSSINLVSRGDLARLRDRHIDDSLRLVPLIPESVARGAIDLGSGAGFPGVVLAIATGLHVDLIEADQRKAAFLREAIRVTETFATVHASRLEDVTLPASQLVTARALAPLPSLLGSVARFLAPDGVALLPKGKTVDQELIDAATLWTMYVERFHSATSADATILRIRNLSPIERDHHA